MLVYNPQYQSITGTHCRYCRLLFLQEDWGVEDYAWRLTEIGFQWAPRYHWQRSGYVYCVDCWLWWWKRMCYWKLKKTFRRSPQLVEVWELLGEDILDGIDCYEWIGFGDGGR